MEEDEAESVEKVRSLLTAIQGGDTRSNADDEGLIESLSSFGHEKHPLITNRTIYKRR